MWQQLFGCKVNTPNRGMDTWVLKRPNCQPKIQALTGITELKWYYLAPGGSCTSVFYPGVVVLWHWRVWTWDQNQAHQVRKSYIRKWVRNRRHWAGNPCPFPVWFYNWKARAVRSSICDLGAAMHKREGNQVFLVSAHGELYTARVYTVFVKILAAMTSACSISQ